MRKFFSTNNIKKHPGRIFRELMAKETTMTIGAFNGLTARMIAQKGIKSIYLSGAGLTASTGHPDIGLLNLTDFTKAISEVYMSSDLPILADADTGFGEGEMCAKTVWEYNRAGAAGLHIEDQVFPKRCGHLDGKSLISVEDMSNKVRIAANARDACSNGDFIICARTDARGVYDMNEALLRADKYVQAGADMIFPEGLASEAEFEHFAKELRKKHKNILLLANMTEFGKTPIINIKTFEKFGYNCVIYAASPLRVAMKAINNLLDDMIANGSVQNSLDKMYTRKELYNLLNYKPGEEWIYPSSSKPKH